MESFAVWYESDKKVKIEVKPELEVHFNHWKIDKKFVSFKSSKYFLDVAFRIKNHENCLSRICLYVPFVVKKSDLTDICNKVKADNDLATAIFNEDYSVKHKQKSKTLELEDNDGNIMNFYCLDLKKDEDNIEINDVNLESSGSGTIIKIKFQHLNNNSFDRYIRFRINSKELEKFSYVYRPKFAFFESKNSKIEIFELRLNEKRNLNSSFYEDFLTYKHFNIVKIHLFVLRNANQEFIISNPDLDGVRELEESIWKNYIDFKRYRYDKVLAYHVKKEKSYISDFSSLLKIKFEKNNLLLHAVFVLVILSVSVNFLSDYLIRTFNPPLSKEVQSEKKWTTKERKELIFNIEQNKINIFEVIKKNNLSSNDLIKWYEEFKSQEK